MTHAYNEKVAALVKEQLNDGTAPADVHFDIRRLCSSLGCLPRPHWVTDMRI